MTWRVGMKVECIRDDFAGPIECISHVPKKGLKYVVRATCATAIPLWDILAFTALGIYPPGLLLREITNPPCDCWKGIERGFDTRAFRPIVEDETKSKAVVDELKKLAAPIKTTEKVK
jgi:hypothetical protein